MQQAFFDYIASIQPTKNKSIAIKIEKIRLEIEIEGKWKEYGEWRISTYFDTEIITKNDGESQRFHVRVECNGQELKAICPNLEKAVLTSMFYEKIIMEQFYSVGPSWA
jgi:hypothetical protein